VRPGSLALLGAAAYSAFLVAAMPARWVAERVLPPGPRSYALQEMDGTIWSGSTRAAFASHAGTFVLDRVEWRFLPSRLLQGRAAYALGVRGAGFEGQGELARSFVGWSLRDLTARGDAAVATAFAPFVGAWRPEGRVTVASPTLAFENPQVRGELRIEWNEAATALSEVKPLGSYRAQVVAEGRTARVDVSTLAGPLRISGKGNLAFPAELAFGGEARAEGPQAAALQPLLDLIGPRRADGTHAIAWRTR
jgi:general secretion pathway protein N